MSDLTLQSTRTGMKIVWNGSHTFNVYDRTGVEVHCFTWFDNNEGRPPTESKAKQLMMKHLAEMNLGEIVEEVE